MTGQRCHQGNHQSKTKCIVAGVSAHCFENLIPAFKQCAGLELTEAITRDPTKFDRLKKEFPNVTQIQSISDTSFDGLDLLIAAGPPDYNAEVASKAVELGVPTFIEKPCKLNHDHINELTSVARVQVGYNLTFTPHVQSIIAACADFGDLTFVSISYATNKPRSPFWNQNSVEESFRDAILCHPVHLISEVFGFRDHIEGKIHTRGDDVWCKLLFQNDLGQLGHISAHNFSPSMEIIIEARYASGITVKSSQLTNWNISDPGIAAKNIFGARESLGSNSIFSLRSDKTGFVEQFSQLADWVNGDYSPNQLVDLKAGIRVDELLKQI